MAYLSSIDMIGSGLTAEQLRLDVISENVVNMNTTRVEGGDGPYRRKMVVFEGDPGRSSFRSVLARARMGTANTSLTDNYSRVEGTLPRTYLSRSLLSDGIYGAATVDMAQQGGVRVAEIIEDQSEFKVLYDPEHPDADEAGYVDMPNVDLVKEITDAMAATQAFSANVTALNTFKTVASRALEIGR